MEQLLAQHTQRRNTRHIIYEWLNLKLIRMLHIQNRQIHIRNRLKNISKFHLSKMKRHYFFQITFRTTNVQSTRKENIPLHVTREELNKQTKCIGDKMLS